VLGTSTLTVGIIEGIAEAAASITKIFSGALSDYLGKRKWLAAFAMASRFHQAGVPARLEHRLAGGRRVFVDRVGQGHPRRAA